MDDFFKFWLFSKKEWVPNWPKFTYSTGFLRRPQKCEEISQLIWHLLAKLQINWAITSDFCGRFRKPELYEKFLCFSSFQNFVIYFFLILSYIFSNSLRGHRHPFPWWFHHCRGHRSHHRQWCQCWPLQSLVPKAPRDLQGFLLIILLEMNEQKKIAAVVQLQFR